MARPATRRSTGLEAPGPPARRAARGAVAALAALLAAGCTPAGPVIDPYPIAVSLDGGVPVVGARAVQLDVAQTLPVVIDTGAPITVIDDGGAGTRGRRLDLDLTRFPLEPLVVRARFPAVRALISAVGAVGAGAPLEVAGVVGGDVLSQLALRIDPSRGQLRFFPDLAGTDDEIGNTCAAVIDVTLSGGGAYVSGNDVVDFLPTRVVIPACLSPETADLARVTSGSDTLLVLATGVAPTILSRSAYRAAAGVDPAAIDARPATTLYFPSDTAVGGELARRASLPRMALVGRPEKGRGPCAELFMARLMGRLERGCAADIVQSGHCPCADPTRTTCPSASSVELDQEIEVAVIEDTDPLLQTLRNELRPTYADIGGLLGMRAIGPLVTDVDYPNSRVVVRCAAGATSCRVQPQIADPVDTRAPELHDKGCLP